MPLHPRTKRLRFAFAAAVIFVASAVFWGHLPRQQFYAQAFDKVGIGDSESGVCELVGVPQDDENVIDSNPAIVKIYVYRVSPILTPINPFVGKEWIVCFDKWGRVVSKHSSGKFNGC